MSPGPGEHGRPVPAGSRPALPRPSASCVSPAQASEPLVGSPHFPALATRLGASLVRLSSCWDQPQVRGSGPCREPPVLKTTIPGEAALTLQHGDMHLGGGACEQERGPVRGCAGRVGHAWACVGVRGVRGVGGVRGVRGRAWACGAELPPVQLLADTTLLSLCSSQPLCTELQMQREPVTKEGSGLNAEQV